MRGSQRSSERRTNDGTTNHSNDARPRPPNKHTAKSSSAPNDHDDDEEDDARTRGRITTDQKINGGETRTRSTTMMADDARARVFSRGGASIFHRRREFFSKRFSVRLLRASSTLLHH